MRPSDSRVPSILHQGHGVPHALPCDRPTNSPIDTPADALLRQLQLHQLELQMQNSALREAQAQLEAERARYAALFDLAPVGYCIVRSDGVIVQANQAAASLLGVPHHALTSHAFSAFMTTQGGDIFYLLSRRLVATGCPEACELPMVRPDGTCFSAQLTCASTQNAAGETALLVVMADMTAREQTQQLRIRQEAAEAASQAKSRFLAAASHDFRQPTHAMGMFLARLSQLPHDSGIRQLVVGMEASVRTLQDMLENWFDVSRFGAGDVKVLAQPFSVAQVFSQLRDSFEAQALGKGLRLRIRPSLVWLHGDPFLLHRILFNLVSNALRYTQKGGVLVVCRLGRGKQQARIEVWDSGIGIHEAHHEKIFEEFYQVENLERNQAKGLGLGLSIVAHTCALLSLPLSMRSAPGHGTRFRVIAPVWQGEPNADPEIFVADAQPDPLVGMRVLVIEDDPLVRGALTQLRASWGCRVMVADGPAQACVLVGAGQGPNIIACGYRLRDDTDGIKAVHVVRQVAGREIPAFLISGDTGNTARKQAQVAGLVLLDKPVRPAKLRSLLRRLGQAVETGGACTPT